MVMMMDEQGRVVARGLANYGVEDARRIIGRPSREIESLLGFMGEEELVHRDNLVLA
jgi:glutamate 5-kinase